MPSVSMQNAGELQAVSNLSSRSVDLTSGTVVHEASSNNPVPCRALKARTLNRFFSLMQMGAGAATAVTHNLTAHSNRLPANTTRSILKKNSGNKRLVDARRLYSVNRTTGISMSALGAWGLLGRLDVIAEAQTENIKKALRIADCAQQTDQLIKLDTLARQLGSELCSIKVNDEYKIKLNRFEWPCVIEGQDKDNSWIRAVFRPDGIGKWIAYRFDHNERIKPTEIRHGPGDFATELCNSVVIIDSADLGLLDAALNTIELKAPSAESRSHVIVVDH